MSTQIESVQVWAGEIDDRPGGMAEKLRAIREAGGNLEFVIARRQPDKPGTGVVFMAPLDESQASKAGMQPAAGLHSLRLEAPDQPGLGAVVTQAIADAGINMRGLSAAALEGECVVYFAFDTEADTAKAREAIENAL